MRLILATCLIGLSISAAGAQTTVYRDKQSNRVGTAEQHGDTTVFRDKAGNRSGSAEQQGGNTVYRDKSGNRTGSSSSH